MHQPTSSTLFPYTTLFRSHLTAGVETHAPGQHARGPRAVPVLEPAGELRVAQRPGQGRSEEHTSELQSHHELVCRLLLEKKKITKLQRLQQKMSTNHHTLV